MDFDKLQRAKSLEASINSTVSNIDHAERLRESDEIMVVSMTLNIRDAFNKLIFSGKDGDYAPMYYTGETKNRIVDAMTKKNFEILDKAKKEFEKL